MARKILVTASKSLIWLFPGLLLLLVCGFILYGWAVSPKTSGAARLAGLESSAEILRDGDGVATIRAGSELDAYRALGFFHAQERLWQMDMMRRAGSGRLSELLGESTLELDRLLRAFRLREEAERQLPRLSPKVRHALEAYAQGVNAFIAWQDVPTPEFIALGYEPEPWQPSDSLIWGNLMALQLSGDWREELLRVRLLRVMSEEKLALFWPEDPLHLARLRNRGRGRQRRAESWRCGGTRRRTAGLGGCSLRISGQDGGCLALGIRAQVRVQLVGRGRLTERNGQACAGK